ncbi:pentatricopeptide repeat-containing protein, partial [Tanacetum coccineum]
EAIELFHEMENAGLVPIDSTLNRIQLTVTLGNAFIDMCAKCGNIDAAVELFNEMGEKDASDAKCVNIAKNDVQNSLELISID